MSIYRIHGEHVEVQELYNDGLGFSRLYTTDGKLLILVSHGYGSPWSVDAGAQSANLLMDARIIRFFYETYVAPFFGKQRSLKVGEAPMKAFLEQLGFEDVYLGGLSNLEIEVVQSGRKFRLKEYDGLESVIFTSDKWFTA